MVGGGPGAGRGEHSMLHRWTAALFAFGNRFVSGPARLKQAVRQSLNPPDEREARILDAQLGLVRTNVRVLDYAFPLVGAILISIHSTRSGAGGPLFAWALLALASAVNEIVLLRRSSPN